MIREVDLVSYLPPFMQEYETLTKTLEAENPEFILLWKAAEQTLQNEFLETADEYGIARFEKMLSILPDKDDSLENRRARVQARWFAQAPCTLKVLVQKMVILCQGNDFEIALPESYKVDVSVSIDPQTEPILLEVRNTLEEFLPANLYYQVTGKIKREQQMRIFAGNTRGICVKIKAEPDKRNSYVFEEVGVMAGIATLNYVRATYQPEKE